MPKIHAATGPAAPMPEASLALFWNASAVRPQMSSRMMDVKMRNIEISLL
jgi:hypothetical protein